MEWLSQNWIWIVLVAGIFFMLRRGGMACGMGHGGARRDNSTGSNERREPPNITKDPVSGQVLDQASAVTSFYRGRVYYFASPQNRDRFEAEPGRYAALDAT
jgi:YHS domain-containing protein